MIFLFASQIWTLTFKTLQVALLRQPVSTTVRAFIFPLVLVLLISYAHWFLNPSQVFGIGPASPVFSLADALARSARGRNTLAIVDNGLIGGNISSLINTLSKPFRDAGKTIRLLNDASGLPQTCESTQRGTSNCFAAVLFQSSLNEPPNAGSWNYTVRADASLGNTVNVNSPNNDAQIYLLPLQHEIDRIIASLSNPGNEANLDHVWQYPVTEVTEATRVSDTKDSYLDRAIQFFGVLFFFAMVGVVYQLTGYVATERELGLSQLIDAMMPNLARWQPCIARLLSHHAAFTIIYLPGWLAMGIVLATLVLVTSSPAITIMYHLTAGLALASYSLLGAAFFQKAQLSGVAMTVIAVALAVIPQVLPNEKQTVTTVLAMSLFFPSANYTYFLTTMFRWELYRQPMDLLSTAPQSPWQLPSIVLWIFLVLQILIFPILAMWVEQILYGTTSKNRTMHGGGDRLEPTVQLLDFNKTYCQHWLSRLFRKKKPEVQAVKKLTLDARRGQIVMLLGRNGSGKSTTMEAIAGLSKVSQGHVRVDGSGGLGITPQKNVLWDELTVEEHVSIFDRLKRVGSRASTEELTALIDKCDLIHKAKALSKTLSGGQKRKLQLAIMFAGGSAVCCIDEVSSGLDPLSRRKIWDILVAQRRDRTIIMTTHFLDEADFLSDTIAILSHGDLRAQGSSASLKARFGDGYHFFVPHPIGGRTLPSMDGIDRSDLVDRTVYRPSNPTDTAYLVDVLEGLGIEDYDVCSPTLEDVFLKLTHDSTDPDAPSDDRQTATTSSDGEKPDLIEGTQADHTMSLQMGTQVNAVQQARLLLWKRFQILRRNYLPYCAAIIIALVGAGVSPGLLKGFEAIPCDGLGDATFDGSDGNSETPINLGSGLNSNPNLVAGPSSPALNASLLETASLYGPDHSPFAYSGVDDYAITEIFQSAVRMVNTMDKFDETVSRGYATLSPGGLFVGDGSTPSTFAWTTDPNLFPAGLITQNMLDNVLSNVNISTSYAPFDLPNSPSLFDFAGLVFCVYFGFIFACYPASFTLYPTLERLRNVRALQYSNGVASLPLWLAYLAFDTVFVIFISAMSTMLLGVTSPIWYQLGYLFVVFVFYGIASTILSYVFSLFARSPLAAWAMCTAYQAVMFLAYVGAYLGVGNAVDLSSLPSALNATHFTLALLSPIANLARAFFISLRFFTLTCGREDSPGSIELYGGPILYLIGQSLALFALLLWCESGRIWRKEAPAGVDAERRPGAMSAELAEEVKRVEESDSGLRVTHLSRSFGERKAVDDVTFGVKPGEIFALLGPNGAGKSTTISLIRGDIQASDNCGEILVDQYSVLTQRANARTHLGVCPQFDATDVMTVYEHLHFYARIRGVLDPSHNVDELIRALGIEEYRHRLAHQLSGGTKRKLSLAIAMVGNPSVLLLDEPSSGLDATSKRAMWTALSAMSANRSIVLTTHSMEEADALAGRAGIMSGRFLALGSCDALRRRWGDLYHIRLVLRTASHSTPAKMATLQAWLRANLAGAVVEDQTYCGQVRLTVPASGFAPTVDDGGMAWGVGPVLRLLEHSKEMLGVQDYSIGHTTLDEVFCTIVREHGGEEEDGPRTRWWSRKR